MKFFKRAACCMLAAVIIAFSAISAFAAEVNGQTAQAGDTVTYTLNLSDVPNPVAGIQLYLYYDPDVLELDESSVSCEGFPGYLCNPAIKGEVMMNASEGVNGYDFSEKTEVISLTFKVLKDGSTDITYYISELYDIYEYGPGDYLKTYTLTSDVKVNGNVVSQDGKPILESSNVSDDAKGDFVNNESGIGAGDKTDETKPTESDSAEKPTEPDVTQSTDPTGEEDGVSNERNLTLIIAIVAAVIGLLLIAVIVLVIILIVRSRKNKI